MAPPAGGQEEPSRRQVEASSPLRARSPDADAAPRQPAPRAQAALEAIQAWLADEERADARLALITEGAMATADGEAPDPAAAAIWGLVRSAQSEHPGRFALIDSDGSEASEEALSAALALGPRSPSSPCARAGCWSARFTAVKPEEDEADGNSRSTPSAPS